MQRERERERERERLTHSRMTFGVGHLPLEVWFKISLLFPCKQKYSHPPITLAHHVIIDTDIEKSSTLNTKYTCVYIYYKILVHVCAKA